MLTIKTGLAAAGAAALLLAAGAQAQTLNYMKALDAPHFDGQRTTWSPTSDVVHLIQDTLTALDWDGKTALPLLAKSWTISPDGKTYTFKMRKGALWSDGSPVTADDFVYSWRRLVDPATASEYAYMLAPVTNAEDITAGKKKPDCLFQ